MGARKDTPRCEPVISDHSIWLRANSDSSHPFAGLTWHMPNFTQCINPNRCDTMQTKTIFCLEDGLFYKNMIEHRLADLLGNHVHIEYFFSLGHFKQKQSRCDLLISDLHLGDSKGEQTAEFLLDYSLHTPVIVQSSDPYLPERLERLGQGKIKAVEKAGRGPEFATALEEFLQLQAKPGQRFSLSG